MTKNVRFRWTVDNWANSLYVDLYVHRRYIKEEIINKKKKEKANGDIITRDIFKLRIYLKIMFNEEINTPSDIFQTSPSRNFFNWLEAKNKRIQILDPLDYTKSLTGIYETALGAPGGVSNIIDLGIDKYSPGVLNDLKIDKVLELELLTKSRVTF